MPPPGDLIELRIEKPAAGGRMLARHGGQVTLVAGAIPGELIVARVERERAGVVYAATTRVLEPHAARRDPGIDAGCGGMSYAHIEPEHQRRLKADVVADAFRRLGKLPLDAPVAVAASPDRGYRMRARLHVRGGRLGSFREGTHEVCDYTATNQLADRANEAVRALAAHLARHRIEYVASIELAENLAGDERAVHVDTEGAAGVDTAVLAELAGIDAITGLSAAPRGGRAIAASGRVWVSDRLDAYVEGLDARSAGVALRRHPRSFFQANRFLAAPLVARVLAALRRGAIVDLYAGVGLFAVCAAARGGSPVIAVEGDRASAGDLRANAAPFRETLAVEHRSVEEFFGGRRIVAPETIIVDPPRTGVSRAAMDGVLRSGASRVVYVSCDVATLARDAARLVAGGHALAHVEAFDLFPNTPHVETLAIFDRR